MPVPVKGGRNARQRARSDHGLPQTRRSERGQATVELALVLPLIFALLVLVFQVALVARDEILVVHVARDAAREATVTRDPGRVSAVAVRNLPGATVRVVRRGGVGERVEVAVTYVSHTNLPLIGALLPDVTLHSDSVMRVERP
jgi:TadE-like protein